MLPLGSNFDYLPCRTATDRVRFGQRRMPQLVTLRNETVKEAHQLIALIGSQPVSTLY